MIPHCTIKGLLLDIEDICSSVKHSAEEDDQFMVRMGVSSIRDIVRDIHKLIEEDV